MFVIFIYLTTFQNLFPNIILPFCSRFFTLHDYVLYFSRLLTSLTQHNTTAEKLCIKSRRQKLFSLGQGLHVHLVLSLLRCFATIMSLIHEKTPLCSYNKTIIIIIIIRAVATSVLHSYNPQPLVLRLHQRLKQQ